MRKIDYIMQQAEKNKIKTEIHRRLREQPGAMELVHFSWRYTTLICPPHP